jgi:predicted nuclease with TOPRIM domain
MIQRLYRKLVVRPWLKFGLWVVGRRQKRMNKAYSRNRKLLEELARRQGRILSKDADYEAHCEELNQRLGQLQNDNGELNLLKLQLERDLWLINHEVARNQSARLLDGSHARIMNLFKR